MWFKNIATIPVILISLCTVLFAAWLEGYFLFLPSVVSGGFSPLSLSILLSVIPPTIFLSSFSRIPRYLFEQSNRNIPLLQTLILLSYLALVVTLTLVLSTLGLYGDPWPFIRGVLGLTGFSLITSQFTQYFTLIPATLVLLGNVFQGSIPYISLLWLWAVDYDNIFYFSTHTAFLFCGIGLVVLLIYGINERR